MSKTAAVFALILISLIVLSLTSIQHITAQTIEKHISINSDGSITPSTAPIQQVGDVYILASDFIGDITVQKSSMTLDGNGHTITGGGVGGGFGGITIDTVKNVTVKNLNIRLCQVAINLGLASNITITNNTITETNAIPFRPTAGIFIGEGTSNMLVGNNLVNNTNGIYLFETEHNIIVGNQIKNSSTAGVTIWESSNNSFYHNNFVNNAKEALDTGVTLYYPQNKEALNNWDDGYPSGGNYWCNYNGTDVDGDGIGDSPYKIDAHNQDNYPLMTPFNISNPSKSPIPSPNLTLTPKPTYSPSPSPPNKTSSPSPTATPTAPTTTSPAPTTSTTPTPTQQPTPSNSVPSTGSSTGLHFDILWLGTAVGVVAVVIVAVALLVRKKKPTP